MAQKSWPWSTAAGLGDGAATLSEAISREFLAAYFGVQNPAIEGVSKGVMNELACTGVASPIATATGSAICYGLYINDTAVNTAVASPVVGTTGGRVVLQTNWGGTGGAGLEARTRIAVKKNTDGVAAIPALTQVFGTTWEISLYTFTITTAGVIALTDDRTFRKSTAVIDTAELRLNSVTNPVLRDSAAVSVIGRAANTGGDPADIAAAADDRVLARVGAVLSWVQLTIGMIPDLLVTEAKLAAAAAAKLVTNGNTHDHNGGDGAAIPAGGLANGAVDTTARLADNIVDDTKVGDRVAQVIRRRGGSATSWAASGTTDYTPGPVRIQTGAVSVPGSGFANVTFPVPFSNNPNIIVSSQTGSRVAFATGAAASNFDCNVTDLAGAGAAAVVSWIAIGPE